MFSIICGLILSETAFVIAIQVSDPLTFTYNIFQGFIISSPPCYDKVWTFCSKSPKISLKTFHELSFRNWRGKLNKPPTFAILPSQPPPYSSLPPLPHAPKPLGTARFRRSEIVSKAASKRSFCVSCEARSQALPREARFSMAGMDAWGKPCKKWEVFTAQWRNERTIAAHGVKIREKKLLDKGLSMLRHTQMFGRNLGFACYKWLDKFTKIFPKWWDALMMMYRGRNLKKYLATSTRNVFTSWWSFWHSS